MKLYSAFTSWIFMGLLWCSTAIAQGGRIKCYFNFPVNASFASGQPAVYLNASFPDTIAAYINRAKYGVDIALYNYTASANSNVAKIAFAANAAAARGVQVRWIYNGTGSTSNTGLNLLSAAVKTFPSVNRSNYIMHNKFVAIDAISPDSADAFAITGSYNWSDQQTTRDINNLLVINSKPVTQAFYQEFNKMWGGTGPNPVPANAAFGTAKTASAQTQFVVDGKRIEVYFSPKDGLGSKLQNVIQSADNDLFFGVYTFTDIAVANLIISKYNSGLQVRGIVDKFTRLFNAYSLLEAALDSNMLVKVSNDLYHNKSLVADALRPDSDPQVYTGSFNWSIQGQNSNDENVVIVHDAAIANQYYQSLCADFTALGGLPCVFPPCPGGNTLLSANVRGNSFQWQADTGNGFADITDTEWYSRTNTADLLLLNPPSNWYGYRYRCIADGNKISDTFSLKFTAYWNGSASTSWEEPANWNCGVLPDAYTDVVINSSVQYFPVVNASTICRSLRLNKAATIALMNGVSLVLTGN
ncbi:MAG TPA: phospholipase D-like domain-containing protein [Ferruginibacter sp.]|nr:phospholipase D-like domain-containing protein [Ferruginibacter sp.]HMP21759.1 phospholipase D-like domain-containing protein [Ferruginibacter sp.]